MCGRFSVGERTVGYAQGFVGSAKNPLRDGVPHLCRGQRILAEPVGEIAMQRPVVDRDRFSKVLVGGDKVAEVPAGDAGNAVCNLSLRANPAGRSLRAGKAPPCRALALVRRA